MDPLISGWKRLQLARTIAMSVLNLHETGWISGNFRSNQFHYLESEDDYSLSPKTASPLVSDPSTQKSASNESPFDCLRSTSRPYVMKTSDEKMTTMFHQLGIILYQLGRGEDHQALWQLSAKAKATVLEEVDKITFGKPYRDL